MLRIISDHSKSHYCNNLGIVNQDSAGRVGLLSGLSVYLDTSINFSFIHFRNSASKRDRHLFSTLTTPKFAISQSEAVSTNLISCDIKTALI